MTTRFQNERSTVGAVARTSDMNLTIRAATVRDRRAIWMVNQEAFGGDAEYP